MSATPDDPLDPATSGSSTVAVDRTPAGQAETDGAGTRAPVPGPGTDFVRQEIAKWRRLIDDSGLEPDPILVDVNGKQQPVIAGLKRISKPGLRVYAKSEELPKVLGGLGIAIISTSKGLMTDKEARKQMIGGEVLAYIW